MEILGMGNGSWSIYNGIYDLTDLKFIVRRVYER